MLMLDPSTLRHGFCGPCYVRVRGFSRVHVPVPMGRADERSFGTAMFGVSTPGVTSWWAGAQSTREEKSLSSREDRVIKLNGSLRRT